MSEDEAGPSSDRLIAMVGAMDAAHQYGYDFEASMWAAIDRLGALDRADLLLISATLSALLTHDFRPLDGQGTGSWCDRYAAHLALRGRP